MQEGSLLYIGGEIAPREFSMNEAAAELGLSVHSQSDQSGEDVIHPNHPGSDSHMFGKVLLSLVFDVSVRI